MSDPAYSQLLDTNQELRSELRDEIFINKSNEKKICSLVKELEQCYRTISLQDNTIIIGKFFKRQICAVLRKSVDMPLHSTEKIIKICTDLCEFKNLHKCLR